MGFSFVKDNKCTNTKKFLNYISNSFNWLNHFKLQEMWLKFIFKNKGTLKLEIYGGQRNFC